MDLSSGTEGDMNGGGGETDARGWDDPVWGTGLATGVEEVGGEQQYLELIGDRLRVAGVASLGRFRRLTDYVNMLQGFFTLRDATLLTRAGHATRVTMPELRLRLDDVAIIGQRHAVAVAPPSQTTAVVVEKVERRLVIMTPAHIVAGNVHVHAGGSLLHFVDSSDPRFIPMSDVRVRWLADRALVGHFEFALVQRAQILGVATEGLGDAGDAGARMHATEALLGARGESVEHGDPGERGASAGEDDLA